MSAAKIRKGDKVIVPPTVSTDDARAKYGDVDEKKPYLQGWAIVQNPSEEDWNDASRKHLGMWLHGEQIPETDERGQPSYSFYRDNVADREIDAALGGNVLGDGVPVLGPAGQAGQDQQRRVGEPAEVVELSVHAYPPLISTAY